MALSALLTVAGCAAPIPSPLRSGTSNSPSPTASFPSSAPSESPVASEIASASPKVPDLGEITRLCDAIDFVVPSDLDCSDAIKAAVRTVAGRSGTIVSVEITWRLLCGAGPCSTPSPDVVEAIIRYIDGGAVGVIVRRGDGGFLTAEAPQAVDSGLLATPPPYVRPPERRAAVAGAPAELKTRSIAPLCGTESAGLAGPFDVRARACFLSSVLNAKPAEFFSGRADVEGSPFTELWRFGGRGPVIVYMHAAGAWSKLSCALLLLGDSRQQIDPTDCDATPFP